MEEPQPTKLCTTCEKQIEVSKFRIHETQCARQNYKCKVCGDIVLKDDREEHDLEAHTKVPCEHCQVEIEKKNHQTHQDSCFMRPQQCRYCEQIVKY
jgi:hypothetical protein